LLANTDWPSLSYAEGNRLEAGGASRFVYNARNHLASIAHPQGSLTRFTYDSLDMLVRIDGANGCNVWEAEKDGLCRRISKTVDGARTEYFWDGDRLAAEIGPDLGLRCYIYPSIDAVLPLGFIDYASVRSIPEEGRAYFVFHDQVGLPVLIEDAAGGVAWRAKAIDPYGAIEVAADARVRYDLRFPGHILDPETGLHDNRFRTYSPSLSCYLQSDPAGQSGGINLYAYAGNPLVAVDFLGLTHDQKSEPASNENPEETSPGTENPGSPGEEEPPAEDESPAEDDKPALMDKEDAEALARQRNAEYREELNQKIANGEMSQKDAGTVTAAVVDRQTGEVFTGHNDRNGDPPENMHPLIAQQVAEAQANPQHPSEPGSHAEVYALNDALNAREAGRPDGSPPLTKADLDQFTQVSEWRKGSGSNRMRPGDDAGRCGNCQTATDGVDNRSGDAPARPPTDDEN
jgi:RHS repeat-associated protein